MDDTEFEIKSNEWPTMSLDQLLKQLLILQTRQYQLVDIHKMDLARSLQSGIDAITALIKEKSKGTLQI
jgi:hypothetical protein